VTLLEKHRLKKIYFAFDLCNALGPPRLEFSACRFPAMPNEVLEVMLDHSTTLQAQKSCLKLVSKHKNQCLKNDVLVSRYQAR